MNPSYDRRSNDIDPIVLGKYMERLDHVAEELLRYANALEAYNKVNASEHAETRRRVKILEDERNTFRLLLTGGFNTVKGLGIVGLIVLMFALKGVYGAVDWLTGFLRG